MTDKEKAIIMAHTGVCMLTGEKFQIFHEYIEEIMGRPVLTHEIAFLAGTIKEKSKADFMALCAEQEPKVEWNNHQIACMLADLFGDTCACNYNGIDEWLSGLCDFKDTCCPNPVGVACWEQFLEHYQSRYAESEE